jgi:hypothetical protein
VAFRPRVPFSTVISRLGLTSGLKLVLDAGDIASAASSTPDKWLDTSGNGYDFFLGAGTGADAADPTFNGTPGSLSTSEFWSSDGGDYFTYDTTNETWMQNLHKDGCLCTVAMWVWCPSATNNRPFGLNGGDQTVGTGAHMQLQGSGGAISNLISWRAANGTGVGNLFSSGTVAYTPDAWSFVSVSINENGGAGASFFNANGATETFNAGYTTPSAANASQTMNIGARGAGNGPFVNTARLAFIAFWEGAALTSTQVNSIYNATHSQMPQYKPTRFFTRKF